MSLGHQSLGLFPLYVTHHWGTGHKKVFFSLLFLMTINQTVFDRSSYLQILNQQVGINIALGGSLGRYFGYGTTSKMEDNG